MFCYPDPRANCGVFVRPGNPLNDVNTPLAAPQGTFLSLQRGDLTGAIIALKTVVHVLEKSLTPHGPLRRVFITAQLLRTLHGLHNMSTHVEPASEVATEEKTEPYP